MMDDRYAVIKLSRLDYDQLVALDNLLSKHGIETVDCVVVEKDWPEYTPTVDAIMARVNPDA